MRNFSLGVGRRDVIFFTGATVAMFVFTIFWDLVLEPLINDQVLNKYFLTLVLFGFALAVAVLTAAAGGRNARGFVPSVLARFGVALQIFGIAITPIGLFYATDPTRSVPVGFAAFSAVIIGIIIAGVGGNMLVPRRA